MTQEIKVHRPKEFWHKTIILGTVIDDRPIEWVLDKIDYFLNSHKQGRVYTPNPEICLKASKDEEFRKTLNRADILIPDGFGLKLGAKLLNEKLSNRITGVDLSKAVLEKYKTENFKIFIYTRTDSLARKKDIHDYFKKNYPNYQIQIGECDIDNCLSNDNILNQINEFEPQILFLTLGAPNQEIWLDRNLKFIPSVKISFAVGGTFDFLTGKIKRAPESVRKLGMEWLFRLYQEPKRLGRIKNAVADFLLKCHEWKRHMSNRWRPNVLAIIKNKNNKYLLQKNARLANHWQFTQGGIDSDEAPEVAVLREVSEELGAPEKLFKIIKQFKATHKYVWPDYAQKLRGYYGQKQIAFLVDFSGTDNDLNIEKTDEVEEFKWLEKEKLLENLHPVRQVYAKKLINEL